MSKIYIAHDETLTPDILSNVKVFSSKKAAQEWGATLTPEESATITVSILVVNKPKPKKKAKKPTPKQFIEYKKLESEFDEFVEQNTESVEDDE